MPSTSPDLNSVNGGSSRIDILSPVRGIGQRLGGGPPGDIWTGFQSTTEVHIKATKLLQAEDIFCETAFLIFN